MGLPTGAGREGEQAGDADRHDDLGPSMGLPTGAGRELEGLLSLDVGLRLQWGCRPGPAERS